MTTQKIMTGLVGSIKPLVWLRVLILCKNIFLTLNTPLPPGVDVVFPVRRCFSPLRPPQAIDR